ncbi:MAG: GtrA family protein [Halofilum sp. (in: g-proteobacteria)]
MLSPLELALRYLAFAVIATAVNIATQDVTTTFYTGPQALWMGIFAGTATGLVTKYLLDRRWIFMDAPGDLADHSRKFSLYSLMGVVTTVIFWGTEWLFDHLSGGDEFWRYTGAVVGLTIGYIAKYRLDRRFVFGLKPA